MSLRASLKNLIRRDAECSSLRDRAADLQADLTRVARQPVAPAAEVMPDFAAQVAQAGVTGDVLAGGGIDHRDGTVSYTDATGKVSRRPIAHWVGFNALQMHTRVRGEIGRRRVLEANRLPGDEHEAWEARIRRDLRADAVFDLAFRSERAFKAAQDLRSGAEPLSAEVRAASDGDLIALASEWEVARDLFTQRSQEQIAVEIAANGHNPPGDAPRAVAWSGRRGFSAARIGASGLGLRMPRRLLETRWKPSAGLRTASPNCRPPRSLAYASRPASVSAATTSV